MTGEHRVRFFTKRVIMINDELVVNYPPMPTQLETDLRAFYHRYSRNKSDQEVTQVAKAFADNLTVLNIGPSPSHTAAALPHTAPPPVQLSVARGCWQT